MTGVQTCALPISHVPRLGKKLQKGEGSQGKDEEKNEIDVKESHGRRSEERRVGKECSS